MGRTFHAKGLVWEDVQYIAEEVLDQQHFKERNWHWMTHFPVYFITTKGTLYWFCADSAHRNNYFYFYLEVVINDGETMTFRVFILKWNCSMVPESKCINQVIFIFHTLQYPVKFSKFSRCCYYSERQHGTPSQRALTRRVLDHWGRAGAHEGRAHARPPHKSLF